MVHNLRQEARAGFHYAEKWPKTNRFNTDFVLPLAKHLSHNNLEGSIVAVPENG